MKPTCDKKLRYSSMFDKFIKGCPQCSERARIIIQARFLGIEEGKALSDATIARELLRKNK